MRFRDFERRARALWDEIPEEFREGVDALVVRRSTRPHPTLPDIYTLGECTTEAYPSDWGGPETIRSILVLYHGSFERLAALDPDFDWQDELWETLTHELRHHLESLADEDALGGVDYAADENFKRLEGDDFDPWFYRRGERRAEGVWQVERDFFLEQEAVPDAPADAPVEFTWRGRRFRVSRPEDTGDVCFLFIEEGLDTDDDEVTLVLVRRRGFLESVRGLLARAPARVVEASGVAEPVERG